MGCNSLPPSVVNPLGQPLWQATREAYWKAVKNVRRSADVIKGYLFVLLQIMTSPPSVFLFQGQILPFDVLCGILIAFGLNQK